ncbi:MAG TPA: hypothetical protein VH639_08300 [Bryobacteraceae bacterium]|jgi:hypothetical protein
MSIRALLSTVVLNASLLLGQLSSNTVTVAASQGASSQPDQAVLSVIVNSDVNKNLDDIVHAVAGAGISAASLTGVSLQSNPPVSPQLHWSFQFPVWLSALKQTTASLAALQSAIGQGGSGLTLLFSVAGAQNSGQRTPSCDLAGLIANARAQAQPIAAGAGLPLGQIAGISGATSQGVGNCSATVTYALGFGGNPGPHTVTITASRTANAAPDQVQIQISATSGVGFGVDDIEKALTQAGISGATLAGVTTGYTYDGQGQSAFLQWSFILTAPLATLKNTIGQLLSAQAALSKQKSGVGLSFSGGLLEVSAQSQPACPTSTLIVDATAQAQALASAAGASVGPVNAISGPPAIGAVRAGDFGAPFSGILTLTAACSLQVQFPLY